MLMSRYFVKKAVRDVVLTFRERGALDAKRARTPQELGLVRPGVFDRMLKARDYKPDALRLLGRANIVQVTEDGRLFLSEKELENSNVKSNAGIE